LNAAKEVEDWLEIEFNGEKGFVSLAFVKKSQASETTTPKLSLAGKKIVLDAGHGGRDSGAIGHGLKEKDVVLDITHKLKSKLENAGATVILTRTNDTYYELSQRTSISNKSGADLFVSIHINASEHTSAAGTETFYYPGGDTRADNSYKLAQTVHEEMINQLGFGNRGIKKASFQVIRYNTLPSILVELGFVSNSYESSQLGRNEIREKFSNSMLVGIHNYFK
jgi:N-acetylmuramoyl-L-alanine amidase